MPKKLDHPLTFLQKCVKNQALILLSYKLLLKLAIMLCATVMLESGRSGMLTFFLSQAAYSVGQCSEQGGFCTDRDR